MENRRNEIDDFFEKKLAEVQKQKLEVSKAKKKKRKSKKGLVISIVALALAGLTAITAFIGFRKKKDNKPEDLIPPTTVTMGIDDLGQEETMPTNGNDKIYGDTTGDIKKEELVEKDGTIWKDKEAADNSDKVGEKETDLKDGELKKDDEGDVVEKEVEDEIPEGYSWDPVLKKYVKTEDVGKYVLVDATYYGPDGEVVFEKGEVVLKETFERIKSQLSTTKPTTTPTTEPTQPTQPTEETTEPTEEIDRGTVNADGTFTIAGVTFKDKETYDRIVAGDYNEEDLRYDENGAIYIKEKTKTR